MSRHTLRTFTDDRGTFVQPGCRDLEDARWHFNAARAHDGLAPYSSEKFLALFEEPRNIFGAERAPEFIGLAVLCGFQPAPADFAPAPGGFWLYNLIRSIPGHPAGSTVAESTLRRYLSTLPTRS